MSIEQRISTAIREALDERGIEITWADTDAAAERVAEKIEDVIEAVWRYEEACD